MLMWNILFYFFILLFLALTTLLIIKKYCKNTYYHNFINDEILKTVNNGGSTNNIYSTSNEANSYIDRYIIRKSIYDTAVVVEYKRPYKHIEYFIKCFNNKYEVIDLIKVIEDNTSTNSKIINVKKNTNRINIFIKNINNELDFNSTEIKPISRFNNHMYSFILSLDFFSLLFVIRHIILLINLGNRTFTFLNSIWNYISLGVILLFTLLLYLITFFSIRRKNWKNKGATDYVFY